MTVNTALRSVLTDSQYLVETLLDLNRRSHSESGHSNPASTFKACKLVLTSLNWPQPALVYLTKNVITLAGSLTLGAPTRHSMIMCMLTVAIHTTLVQQ